jgi:uncharacterized protein YndB with AHSA1/START domain
MANENQPQVEAQMLIRKPSSEVFEAFIDPGITTKFWFTKSSGKVETGVSLVWEWEMYNASTTVFVKEVVVNEKIIIEWGEPATTVVFNFIPQDNNTYVIIKNYGFTQTGNDLIAVINDSAGGFTTVLDGLKAFLEHDLVLNLIADKFPAMPQ